MYVNILYIVNINNLVEEPVCTNRLVHASFGAYHLGKQQLTRHRRHRGPTIQGITGPYRFFFYSFDCDEPKLIPKRIQRRARTADVQVLA